MQSLWDDTQAQAFLSDPLQARVYSSRLLGANSNLVLHGGGNTSVKTSYTNIFGETEQILYVKGSGWDLASIEAAGFPGVKLDVLKKMALLDELSDAEMVKMQRAAMLDPNSPTPSVEAILHAIIPFDFVDHTHADAVVTISNTPNGSQTIQKIYGSRVLIIPYTMPGFVLAKKIHQLTHNIDWQHVEGMILLNHGVFSFANDAKSSYERMIKIVSEAEDYISQYSDISIVVDASATKLDLLKLAELRNHISRQKGNAMLAKLDNSKQSLTFANRSNTNQLVSRGPLTPDHVIRTKRIPLIISGDMQTCIEQYATQYIEYFQRNKLDHHQILDTAPRWAVWPKVGVVSFGDTLTDTQIVSDIKDHTIRCILHAESIQQWEALPEQDIFDIEYWELEQAKLKNSNRISEFRGKVALVTGAASGIGKACVDQILEQGGCAIALDISPNIETLFDDKRVLGLVCDISNEQQIISCINKGVRLFGGLDILVNNAGIFPVSSKIESLQSDVWERSISVNLSGHQKTLTHSIPFLKLGIDPCVIFIASKNVPAPGPGAAAYSAAKAGLTQLARIAALELSAYGIRVNIIHPNAVFDTAIWTDEVLEKRAQHYNLSVEQYKTNNLLKKEVTSKHVARLTCAMASSLFSTITGAQIPIDGGNERVI